MQGICGLSFTHTRYLVLYRPSAQSFPPGNSSSNFAQEVSVFSHLHVVQAKQILSNMFHLAVLCDSLRCGAYGTFCYGIS